MSEYQDKPIALFQVDKSMSAEQRQRLAEKLSPKTAALVQGAAEIPMHDSDTNYVFRQESYFQYLFQYQEPDCFGLVEGQTGKSVLFVPKLDPSYAIWMGKIPSLEEIREQVKVDMVAYTCDMVETIQKLGIEELLVLVGINTDSGLPAITAKFDGIDKFTVEASKPNSKLFNILSNQRVIKTKKELELLERVCKISSDAHIAVMRSCKPGMSQNQLESRFHHECYSRGGCRFMAYTCICATGINNATLHYPNNDKWIVDGEIALLDMGAEYDCYASDITCSFPVNGKFTEKQKWVYNAVLDAQTSVFKAMKPGVSWVDMHKLSEKVMLKHLIEHNVLINCDLETAEKNCLGAVFQPHGLGHLIGLNVHDVGGYPEQGPARPSDPGVARLRTARTLEENMYITVEPGLYFNKVLLQKAFDDEKVKNFFNEKLIREEYWEFGGVRIEDDTTVTKNGMATFTCCPRTIEEIEGVMANKEENKFVFEKKEFINC